MANIVGVGRIVLPVPGGRSHSHRESFEAWRGTVDPVFAGRRVLHVPVEAMMPKENNMVTCSDALLQSVRQRGVVNPLLVTTKGGALRVYVGNQRLAAARALSLPMVPCVFVFSDKDVEECLGAYEDA